VNRQTFIAELKAMGFEVTEGPDNFVVFPYTVQIGRFIEKKISLALEINGDAPLNPPAGPHVSPRLLPQNPNADPHPRGGVHESTKLGADWQYWSRPFAGWKDGERTARRYMAHITTLFATQ
jgi:hypothetical protein